MAAGGITVALVVIVGDHSTLTSAEYWLTRLHVWARLCAILVAAFAVLALLFDLQREPSHPAVAVETAAPVAPARAVELVDASTERPHYRHSVIPGGAYSSEELAAIIRRDTVVAAHYSTVDAFNVRPVVTTAPRMAYVSYRVGDRVFWTRKPVRIPAGETLL